jgi:hypothetical protein
MSDIPRIPGSHRALGKAKWEKQGQSKMGETRPKHRQCARLRSAVSARDCDQLSVRETAISSQCARLRSTLRGDLRFGPNRIRSDGENTYEASYEASKTRGAPPTAPTLIRFRSNGADSAGACTEMVHGRARAPSRQARRVALNEVQSKVPQLTGAVAFYFPKRQFLGNF